MDYENPFDGHIYDDENSIENLENTFDRWVENNPDGDIDDFWYGEALLRNWDQDWMDRSADGELAEYMVDIGLREEDWDWDVGDTP